MGSGGEAESLLSKTVIEGEPMEEGEHEEENEDDEEEGNYRIMRPKAGPRRQLNPDGRFVANITGKQPQDEPEDDQKSDELEISCVNENGNYDPKLPSESKGDSQPKTTSFPPI